MKNFNQYFKENIIVGDVVVPIRFDGLTDKQYTYLTSKNHFYVNDIVNKDGEDYIDIGYNIPLKLNRFKKYHFIKKRILFLQFNQKIDSYGEPDIKNYFRKNKNMYSLFSHLFYEKDKNILVDFYNYNDVYKIKSSYYINEIDLKDYDFIFFGFISNYTNIAKLIIEYVDRNNVPNIKYETYNFYHNKAYQYDIIDRLGYPYIPSVMTVKLTSHIKKYIANFGFPLIVKNVYLDRGEGVHKINNEEELKNFYKVNEDLTLIQKYIPNDGEYRVITLKNEVQIISKKDSIPDVNKLNLDNRKSKKGYLPEYVLTMCEDLSKHLESDVIGFDIIQSSEDGTYYIMETNASPHFVMFSIVSDVNLPDIIVNYIIKNMK